MSENEIFTLVCELRYLTSELKMRDRSDVDEEVNDSLAKLHNGAGDLLVKLVTRQAMQTLASVES